MGNNINLKQGILRTSLLLASTMVLSGFVADYVQADETVTEEYIVDHGAGTVEGMVEDTASSSEESSDVAAQLTESVAEDSDSTNLAQESLVEEVTPEEDGTEDTDSQEVISDAAVEEETVASAEDETSTIDSKLGAEKTESAESTSVAIQDDESEATESSASTSVAIQEKESEAATEASKASSESTGEETDANESELEAANSTEEAITAQPRLMKSTMTTKQATQNAKAFNPKANVSRIEGRTRYINATEISKAGWKSSDKVILTNGLTFADSLTGSSLAGKYDAPILYTRTDRIEAETIAEIKRLGTKEVIVLGGEKSVPEAIINELRSLGVTVRRIDGNNRYTVAANIAKEVKNDVSTKYDAFLASGEVASDALSIAPIAASKRSPIYLTRNNRLEQAVIDAIPYVNRWTVIGSNNTISDSVINQMIALGANVRRIGGSNRYEVNRNIIDYYVDTSKTNSMYVVSGEHFSDAIPSAVLAAKKNTGLLLVKNDNITTIREQKDFARRDKDVNNFIIIGGEKTISHNTADKLENTYIFLDPGHGGYETGAYYHGVAEKDINLQVSNKVNRLLSAAGYNVFQSRTLDQAVGLYERPNMANKLYNDIFISVHHNAMPGATGHLVSGIETFYYEYTPGEAYQPLKDNYYTYLEAINPVRRDHSIELATAIHDEAIKATGAFNRGVKENDFVVNRETTMPSVLLELGFMSNYAELKKLTTDSYQNTLANAIFKGIDRYFA